MRVLVQLSCLVLASAVLLQGPDADRFCDRGTKRSHGSGSWFCCPQTCGGRCLADADKCADEKKHNPDVYNPSCCIPEAIVNAKQCDKSSAPCTMEKEWNDTELAAYRQSQFEAATDQKTKKFAKVDANAGTSDGPVAHQRHMEDNFDEFYKNSKAYKDAAAGGKNPMTIFSDAFNGCSNLFRIADDIRGTCVHSDGTDANKLNGNHKDHKMDSDRKLGKNQMADYYWGHENKDAADAFIRCVATETNAKCGTKDKRTQFGKSNAEDCDFCSMFV